MHRAFGIGALLLFAGIFCVATFTSTQTTPPSSDEHVQPVNAVLGDESFVATFGTTPTASTPEDLRLKTHLSYVEGLLRARDVRHLTPEQQERRNALLDRLRAYWKAGIFPRNTERPNRTPVFIDEEGRLCAVGYLIAESEGLEAVEKIDERFHLAYVEEIDAPMLEEWAEAHGFTRHELAMIQPMYCDRPGGGVGCIGPVEPEDDSKKISNDLEIAGMSASASAALVNGYLAATNRDSRWAAGLGLLSGGTGLAMGLSGHAHYAKADVALAGASILASGWNLLRGGDEDESVPEPRRPAAALDVSPAVVPDGTGEQRMGLHLRWNF